ncbi:MAG: discoidin domain-containing protein, partial [Prosthecobacter sp.]
VTRWTDTVAQASPLPDIHYITVDSTSGNAISNDTASSQIPMTTPDQVDTTRLNGIEMVLNNAFFTHRAVVKSTSNIAGNLTRIFVLNAPGNPVRDDLFGQTLSTSNLTNTLNPGSSYYLENSKDFCNYKGEWFLDTPNVGGSTAVNTLYYFPGSPAGFLNSSGGASNNPNDAAFYVPRVTTLLSIKGIKGNNASRPNDIEFRGLVFEMDNWTDITTQGGAFLRSKICPQHFAPQNTVHVEYADKIRFTGNTFRHTGGAGALSFYRGVKDSEIVNNLFYDLAGNGIEMDARFTSDPTTGEASGRTPITLVNETPDVWTNRNLISQNIIQRFGQDYFHGAGCYMSETFNTVCEWNDISDAAYEGIHLGPYLQNAGYDNRPEPNNAVWHNNIHDVMRLLSDGGAFYIQGNQGTGDGTLDAGSSWIAFNHIHQIKRSRWSEKFGPSTNLRYWPVRGLYLDQGSSGMLIQENYMEPMGTEKTDGLAADPLLERVGINTVDLGVADSIKKATRLAYKTNDPDYTPSPAAASDHQILAPTFSSLVSTEQSALRNEINVNAGSISLKNLCRSDVLSPIIPTSGSSPAPSLNSRTAVTDGSLASSSLCVIGNDTTVDPHLLFDLGSPRRIGSIELVSRQDAIDNYDSRRNIVVEATTRTSTGALDNANWRVLGETGPWSFPQKGTFVMPVNTTTDLQFIRVKRKGSGVFTLAECRIMWRERRNVALDRPCTGTGANFSQATDGNIDTGWGDAVSSSPFWQVDLVRPYVIDIVEIVPRTNINANTNERKNFEVWAANAEADFNTARSVRLGSQDDTDFGLNSTWSTSPRQQLLLNTAYRFVRFIKKPSSTNPATRLGAAEIRVYGR